MYKAYLAGPIEYEADAGKGWREDITPRLLELGIEALDPTTGCGEETPADWDQREQAVIAAKQASNWPELTKLMRRVWIMNKNGVDVADMVIVYCRDDARLAGTIREMHEAYEYHKPIFLVVAGDARKLKSHILYMALRRGQIFQNFDELLAYLPGFINKSGGHFIDQQADLYQITQKLLVVNDQNQLLILKDIGHPFYFDLPGGRLNIGEFDVSLAECLEREVREELGTDIKLIINYDRAWFCRLKLWDMILRQDSYRRVLLIGREAEYQSGEIKLSDEHIFYKWVDVATYDPTDQFKPELVRVVKEFLEYKKTMQ